MQPTYQQNMPQQNMPPTYQQNVPQQQGSLPSYGAAVSDDQVRLQTLQQLCARYEINVLLVHDLDKLFC